MIFSYRERQIEFNELCLKDNEKQDAFNGLSEDVMKEYDLVKC